MGILDVFRSSPASMETISTDAEAPPPLPPGPPLVVLICPNHGKILGFEAQAPTSCCATVPAVRADVRTVRMHPTDGSVIGCVRL